MPGKMVFSTRKDFREWLKDNCQSNEGIWVVFGKNSKVKALSAADALEEALCFGWIDGQIQSLDDQEYMKYFKKRRDKSNWSEKNKNLVKKLEENGLMTKYGLEAIELAKQNGSWISPVREIITEEQVSAFESLVKNFEPAYTNYSAMSASVKKNYVGMYFSVKTEEGRDKKIKTIIERLNRNLNPMERMK